MKCDICNEETENIQTFTMKDGAQLRLCRKDYDHMVANFQVTGKLVPKKCKACKSVIGYTWIPYKAPGRKRKSSVGNSILDTFYDMRSPLERVLGEKEKKPRKAKEKNASINTLEQEPRNLCKGEENAPHDGDNVPAQEGASIPENVQADSPPGI